MLQKLVLPSFLLSGAYALTMRQNGCSFRLRTEGTINVPVNQFDSGQARAGVNETPSNFTVNGDVLTDAQGRGCWWTPPALILQCDPGQTPEAGFSIGCDGAVSFQGQSTFYECDTGADNLTMLYLAPNGSRCGQITLRSDACFPAGCNGPASATIVITTVASSTSTLPLGGLTSYWDLVSSLSTGAGSAPTIGPSIIPPGIINTSTLPLGGLTSYWDLISSLPTGSGSATAPGATATGTGSAPAPTGSACPGDLTPGTYEFPHLIIPLDSSHPDVAAGTSYFGEVSTNISSAFNFDIPSEAAGKTCTVVFYFPLQSQLVTSSYNFTGPGGVYFARLSAPVSTDTSYANVPAVAESYGATTLAPGNAYSVAALPCPAGQSVAFEMSSGAANGGNSTDLRYFQDYNPCPIGLQQLSRALEQLKKPKLQPAHKPKTWRLFIDLNKDNPGPVTVTNVAIQDALKSQLHLDLDKSQLRLVALQSGCYCATLSLGPMEDPFTSGEKFDLEIGDECSVTYDYLNSAQGTLLTCSSVTPDDDFLHMTTLYDGTDGKTNAVDLIVVPGLSSHPYGSFKSPINAAENWLRDYLPEDLPDVRILVYGYDSDLRNRKGKQSISDLSKNLLQAIHSHRSDGTEKRPIIFIGHSLGGLLIKQAMVHAHNWASSNYPFFLDTCYGLLFFGVPNRGLRNEDLSTILGHSPTTQLVTDLVVDDNSEVKPHVRTLGEEFVRLFQDKGLDIVTFYETYKSPTVVVQEGSLVKAGEERLLVTQDSATMIDGNTNIDSQFPMAANHSTMVKYKSRHDVLYKSVFPRLKKMAERAPKVTKENLSRTHGLSEEQIRRLDQLRTHASIERIGGSIAERPNSIAHKCDGTLEWFLEEQTFKEWRDATTAPPLWICGPPGQGKSVLAKFLTGHLEERFSKQTNETTAVISFFCNTQEPGNSQTVRILYGLLLQVISCKEHYELIDEIGSNNFSHSSFNQLWGWFGSIMRTRNKQRVYCIIDAFDECAPTKRAGDKYTGKTERRDLMEKLVDLSSQNNSQLRLLVTSRPGEDDITSCLHRYGYSLEANHHDLEEFVRSSLTSLHVDEDLKLYINRKLSSKAGGTFLWVSMVVEELIALEFMTDDAVDQTLESIPTKLEEMYSELLKRQASRSKDCGKILVWVAYAKGPLTVTELSNALNFDPHKGPKPYTRLSDMKKYDPKLNKDLIIAKLGNFLCIHQLEDIFGFFRYLYPDTEAEDLKPLEYVVFRHQSIKDFFDSIKHSDSVVESLIDGSDPDLYLARTCLSYLNAEEWRDRSALPTYKITNEDLCSKDRMYGPVMRFKRWWKKETNSSDPLFFLHYAATSWYKHLSTREQAEHKDVEASIKQLLHENSWFARELTYGLGTFTSRHMQQINISLGDAAILLGIMWLVEQILDGEFAHQSISLVRLACDNPPLFESLFAKRKEQVSQMLPPDFLLQAIHSRNAGLAVYGILKNVPGKRSMITEEVLEAAASHGDSSIMKQLLESEANITITDNCLQKAAQNKAHDIMRLLLEYRCISLALASELVCIAASSQWGAGPMQVLLDMYGNQICITEEHLLSAWLYYNHSQLNTLLNHMRLNTITEATIISILKYYQSIKFRSEGFGDDDDIIRWLLCSPQVQISINENTVELAAQYVPHQWEMSDILQLRDSELPISESMVAAAASNQDCGKEILKIFHRRDEKRVKFTEKLMLALLSNKRKGLEIFDWIVDSSLLPDSDAVISQMVSLAIHNPIPGADIIEILTHKKPTFEVTKDMIKAATTSWLRSYQEFIQHNLSRASWHIHCTGRGLVEPWLRRSGIDSKYSNLLRSSLGAYADVLNLGSDEPQYGTGQWTDLHYAAYFDDPGFIRKEIRKGANVNCRNRMQATPLHLASFRDAARVVVLLLSRRATDIDALDEFNRTPLHYAARRGSIEAMSTLIRRGASIDPIDVIYQTPLHYAVQYGQADSARLLLDNPTNANALDAYGRTIVEITEIPGHLEMIFPSDPKEPRKPRKATEDERKDRLSNVIYILTSQLLKYFSCDELPGFQELGYCLALLGKENEALFAYTQAFEREIRPMSNHAWGPGRDDSLSPPFWGNCLDYCGLSFATRAGKGALGERWIAM
ncbi:hypothetical protein F5Y10DRAFT_273364 [Nemania abortiva]|nr:hypothetical protein F5Y10DRAFT_273364 [Nemania abortiva]